MEPSVCSTSSTRWRRVEAGVTTFERLRSPAFLMRAIMSPMGSLAGISSSSPARLHEAGNLAERPKLAQRDPAHLQLAIEGARAPRDLAAVADARRRRVARHGRQLQARVEALLQREVLVVGDRLESVALGGLRLHQGADHFI